MARRKYNIDFMGIRYGAFAFSMVLLLGSLALLGFRGLNFGLDFTGGTLVEMSFGESADPERVRQVLEREGVTNSVVQNFGTERDILVRTPPQAGREMQALGNLIGDVLSREFAGAALTRIEFVGPAVGEELRETGGLALLLALGVVSVYIMFRYTGKFAIGATVALIHDPIVTLGAFAAFGWTFDLPALAAVLAVIGYSINDTIVVYDRIRENFRLIRRATPIETINISLNQTLDRTIGTSFMTLLAVLSLLLFGGEVVRSFALALLIGVVIGTYSSVYIAANTVVLLGIKREDLLLPEKERESSERP
jgi:preprotein translocase subunit SecF